MGNNNNLNKRIIENVRNRVVISNIETVEKYQFEEDGVEYNIEVNKDTLNDLDSKAWVELDEGDEVLEFEMQYDYVDEK